MPSDKVMTAIRCMSIASTQLSTAMLCPPSDIAIHLDRAKHFAKLGFDLIDEELDDTGPHQSTNPGLRNKRLTARHKDF